ncbi:glycoside hydrolase family 15 protein [Gilvimarinus polysaccharolyticus]|uniref:glycoside hydrolase family 15 protein n=1 Tax=Gilvimarinus polysaccharolyticus TaxID=863921 RepID=UPI0006738F3B|nr:glycoside hydrolase family 15 protein [Gilvimarinus polysaccharolyticus]
MTLARLLPSLIGSIAVATLAACNDTASRDPLTTSVAPGAPGNAPTWAYSGKTGIGTSYEQYVNGEYSDQADTGTVSKVWFSVAEGIVTETMYGLIHQAQLKDMQFVISGPGFVELEQEATNSRIEYLHTDEQGRPLSLAYKITNTDKDGLYQIEKQIVTDPEQQTLLQRVTFTALTDNITAHLVANPHIANTGTDDSARGEGQYWYASEGDTSMVLTTQTPVQGSVGFVGTSDLLSDLADGSQDHFYHSTGSTAGNVSIALTLPTLSNTSAQWDFALGFGNSDTAARTQADASLERGFEQVLADYNGAGDAIGWQDYLASLGALPTLSASATDGGQLAYASAMVLKAQEDKTHAGALIASLSNPWGDIVPADKSATGYKAVWPRDFYQVAMAFLALGDTQTPEVAFRYLKKVQVGPQTPGYSGTPGWFLQKTHVDGTLEWFAVQLDQTAMPIMLGWRLWQDGILSDTEARQWYTDMLRPAADFLADGGDISLDWNRATIHPPFTQQERWEEQEGHSPSTTAAVIAGLVSAAELAELAGEPERAQHYLSRADEYVAKLIPRTVTNSGALTSHGSDGRYFLRINRNENPNDNGALMERNGQSALNESEIVDPGFLELVRYGVLAATDPAVRDSLAEIDNPELPDYLRVKYDFNNNGQQYSGWRRYGGDGYGERINDGAGYAVGGKNHAEQRGRVWPFLSGERGHYELAYALASNNNSAIKGLNNTYAGALEAFANEGLMLPEQVWDGVGDNSTYQYAKGQGTNSATPLAWTHAEYIKLLRSLNDRKVWDHYPSVEARYRSQ